MKRLLVFVFLISTFAVAAPQSSPPPMLPKVFAGWQQTSDNVSADPAKADPTYTDLLKEDGFQAIETAEYSKPGRKMTVKAARFDDATGAYGAYLFYRTPQMAKEDIADQAASNNERVLFRKGDLLIDVQLDKVTAMSAGELRELASDLPQAAGNQAKTPTVATYLPAAGMVAGTEKFAQGPVGLSRVDSPLPPELIDFGTEPELASADYNTSQGDAKLTVIAYPEPAIAGARLRAIEAWHPTAAVGSTQPPKVYAKRTGRLVAVVTGDISEGEAKTLLAAVNNDAEVTWNENTHFDRNSNLGSLLVNIIILIAILTGLAIVAGFAFGGVRIVLKRLFPDRVFDRSEDVEIIRLNIGR
ncbi:MAG TPA: DUF6599 family protein [Terriglobales bacterium]|nr:DUF6599 family protein [Terriglobales bacterium]